MDDSIEYNEFAEKLQADLEERAPLLTWYVYRAAEATVPRGAFRVDARATINGRRMVRAMQVEVGDDDVVEQIIRLTTGGFARIMASKEVERWTVPSAERSTA